MRHGFRWLCLGSVLLFAATGAAAAPPPPPPTSFIDPAHPLDVRAWEPPAPAPGSIAEALDKITFFDTRALIDAPRGAEAAADDVYDPPDVAPRFADALGATLTVTNAPVTLNVIARLVNDAAALVAPIKVPLPAGRIRPFVAYPGEKHCVLTPNDIKFNLAGSGSYPSTHAMVGWIWASVLSAAAPDRADAIIARGIAFGDSRVVCGFHYASDVNAGRLAAAALMARVVAEPRYLRALAAVKQEIAAVRKGKVAKAADVAGERRELGAVPAQAPQ